jgi:hypothetical protein
MTPPSAKKKQSIFGEGISEYQVNNVIDIKSKEDK